jgi:hypothetical protein
MKIILLTFLIHAICFAQSEKLQEEKEMEVVNFNSIKKVLSQDGLSEAAFKKDKELQVLKAEQTKLEIRKYFYPTESELWGFVSDYWLIKNSPLLSWDFEKPDFGIGSSFSSTMESLGFYQKKYKILLMNSPHLVRGALPGHEESILLLSLPFIKSLDLSRLEISLLLFEDYIRLEQGYFKKNVATEKMRTLAGTNFQGNKPDASMVEELLKNYGNQTFQKGYSFQQMFEVTKKMDTYLKSHPELWNTYFLLLGKIDRFIKTNIQYKNYINLYPSPEMQVKWLSPDDKVL